MIIPLELGLLWLKWGWSGGGGEDWAEEKGELGSGDEGLVRFKIQMVSNRVLCFAQQ